MEMDKAQIIEAMRKIYMPNFYDIEVFDYTSLNDNEVFQCYLNECENYGKEEVNAYLEKYYK